MSANSRRYSSGCINFNINDRQRVRSAIAEIIKKDHGNGRREYVL